MSTDIPYEELYDLLFPTSNKNVQEIIPFIGAGVPISERKDLESIGFSKPAKSKEFMSSLQNYDLSGSAVLFLELAFIIAAQITQFENNNINYGDNENDPYKKLKNAVHAPTASELANLFSYFANYSAIDEFSTKLSNLLYKNPDDSKKKAISEMLNILLNILGINGIQLSSISDYYQTNAGRDRLWSKLKSIIEEKEKYTLSHKIIAKSAHDYINNNPNDHYLILTTNYDSLMEQALDELDVNYVTLSTLFSKTNSRHTTVSAKFSQNLLKKNDSLKAMWDKTKEPKDFALILDEWIVIINKIHGSIFKNCKFQDDNIIISDIDYINFISQNPSQHIPSIVTNLFAQKRFLFLGYSLNDWNIRSIFKEILEKRPIKMTDYAILNAYTEFEKLYFESNGIRICELGLKEFFSEIERMYNAQNIQKEQPV
jgi:hypothetical protein